MNAVELDVGNLRQWLLGNIGTSGTLVDPSTQNGYLLYFSDRRGMQPDPNAGNVINGEAGLEDVVNSASAGIPDGVLEPATAGYNNNTGYSPEDVDENGQLDKWGEANISLGFGTNSPNNPYVAVELPDCRTGQRRKRRASRASLGRWGAGQFTNSWQ